VATGASISRFPICRGAHRCIWAPLGERGGEQAHTLSISEIPTHVHTAQASPTDGDQVAPANNYLGPGFQLYGSPANLTSLIPGTIGNVGGSQAHLNMQPFLVLSFCIALQGIFPSQT
jgi:microcystin-dependent protein